MFTANCYKQGHISVICGLPDMGKVCEEHVRGYIDMADALKDEGVKKVVIMAVDKASVIDSWLKEKYGDACSGIEAVGDENGAFTRMLGVNINDPDRAQKTQRCICFSACCTHTSAATSDKYDISSIRLSDTTCYETFASPLADARV